MSVFVLCRCGCGVVTRLLDDRRRTRSGYVRGHHPNWQTRRPPRGTCSLPDCERPHLARGFCRRHYSRWYKRGTVAGEFDLTREQRFWCLVEKTESCWLWRGAVAGRYGRFWVGSRNAQAHRYAYEFLVGEISIGHELDHECENKLCVNPAHLTPVTAREHAQRTLERRRGQAPKSLSPLTIGEAA